MRTHRFTAVLLLLALVGCATARTTAVRIDGSSPAVFEASWKALVATLSQEQQAKLNTAVFLIGTTKLHNSGYKEGDSFGPETLRTELDGKTYDEIIKAGAATGTKVIGVEHRGGAT
jgi:hypothetical protein